MSKDVDAIKKEMRKKRKPEVVSIKKMVSTGSTLLNKACTGRTHGGFVKGKIYLLVGDSTSGKTWLAMTCLAEAMQNKRFKKYRIIYDNIEDGMLMDVEYYFGKEVAKRLEPPKTDDDGNAVFSETADDFYFNVDDAVDEGIPFFYILDSENALSSEEEEEKFNERKDAKRKGKKAAGSYGDGKAKKHSSGLRRLMSKLRKTGSILIIISQTRDNLGFGFEKKTRSGGRALKFYATLELWSSVAEKIKKTVNGKPRKIGVRVQIDVKKNRVTGKDRTVTIPIYTSLGIDDIGSCVEYLVEEGRWKKTKGGVNAKDFDFKGSVEQLVKHIEEEGLERELRAIVGEVWDEIEDKCSVDRKARYL